MKQLTKEGLTEIKRQYEEKCRACYKKHKDSLRWIKVNCRTCYLRLALEDLDREKNAKTPINYFGE